MGPVTALAGVCLQDVERGAHEGGKRPLASRLRPVSSKATHPPTYLPLHTAWGQAMPMHSATNAVARSSGVSPASALGKHERTSSIRGTHTKPRQSMRRGSGSEG